ncbi:MAG: phosphate acyltransferase PlsX [Thermomicrobiaceae bacterium]
MKHVTVALDAMGGDRAPDIPVRAALRAATDHGIAVTLIGNQESIKAILVTESYPDHLINIVDAPEHVSMEDQAVKAVRGKRRASIPVGLELLKSGDADVFLSAGNTGAVVASSILSLGRLPGVDRPGIAIPIPTAKGPPLLLIDAGALVDPKPEQMWQHARLATTFYVVANQVSNPTVGLISNGEESGKGNGLVRAVHKLLGDDEQLQFIGNVEPRAMPERPCDILVTDGFTGNVILKTGEGIVNLVQESLRTEFKTRWYTSILATLLKPAIRRAGKALDYREYGGAPLLGVNGLVMIAHGGSDVTALVNGILTAARSAERNTLAALATSLDSNVNAQSPNADDRSG